MKSIPLPPDDIDHVLAHTEALWRQLDGERLFITGGTGFFGIWLLESLVAARRRFNVDVRATVLSRAPENFKSRFPWLAGDTGLAWIRGDVRDFAFPAGSFGYIFHMATVASAQLNDNQPLLMLSTIVDGTRHTLEFAKHCKARRFLLTSSGAIYGPQPTGMSHIPEDYAGGPDPLSPLSAYAEGKRMAELLCTLTPQVECVIARCFAFIGPHLPLDAHFAAGNFLRDALAGGPITLKGDGSAVRSYLHATDLVLWLLTLMLRGTSGRAYNVGSDQAVTTLELAQRIAAQTPIRAEPRVMGRPRDGHVHQYLPSIDMARKELGLDVFLGLEDAISRTLIWHLHS